jgi:DNA-directed RNA polymerase beta' subunit
LKKEKKYQMQDEAEIVGIQFGIWSADDIRRQATIDLTDHGTKGNSNAFYDGSFGTISSRVVCFDCRGNTDTCTGHWGVIELPCAIPNPFFYDQIKKLLQCFCRKCSSLLYTKDRIELNNIHKIPGPERIKQICEILKKSNGTFECPNENCCTPVNEVSIKDDKKFIYKYINKKGKKKNAELDYDEICEMFKNISNEDLEILGFNEHLIDDPKYRDPSTFVNGAMYHRHQTRPEDFFVQALPVLPLCIRSYTCQGKEMKHDDATILYQLILKDVNKYKNAKKNAEIIKAKDNMQKNIFSLFKQKGDTKGIKKPYNSIHNRLSGKEGHCRGAVESKRANYGARSVIGNAPYLPFGCIEIPQEITKVTQVTYITSICIDKWNDVLKKDRHLIEVAQNNYLKSKEKYYCTCCDKKFMSKELTNEHIEECNKIVAKCEKIQSGTYKCTKCNNNFTSKSECKKHLDTCKAECKEFLLIQLNDKTMTKYEPVIQYIIRNNKKLSAKRRFIKELKIGDIIHRRLQDNDMVIGNRQPTIRKESFNSYRVHVSPDASKRTICLPLPNCSSLNADFDGDEANLHVPQGPQCQAEMATQMNIINKIITDQTSSNIVDLIQGVIYGLHILSKDSTFIDIEIFFNLLTIMDWTDYWGKKFPGLISEQFEKNNWKELLERASKFFPKLKKGNKSYKDSLKNSGVPGKVVFSFLLPKYYSSDIGVKFENGKLVEGVRIKNGILFDGELTKNTMNRIIEELYINFGRDSAIYYIDGANFLCNTWNTLYGFTFSLDDCLNVKQDEIDKVLKETNEEVEYINSMPKSLAEKEILIKEVLSAATQIGQRISKDGMVGGELNAMAISTRSKAKGSFVNLCYISCFLGLQTVLGNRYSPQLCEKTRTLPCFKRGDTSPEARGFVKSNFYKGLDPAALFFHSWSARKGLVDTAVTTRTSGYSHRQFGKKMENARIDQFGTIRDCDGSIIDFCYGEFGFDAAEVYWVNGVAFFIDIPALAKRINLKWENENPNDNTQKITFTQKYIDILTRQLMIYGTNAKKSENCAIKSLKNRIDWMITKNLKGVEIYANKKCLDEFFSKIRVSFYKSRAAPGNMVGFKATCAIGEGSTQDVLNAFHHSGTSSKTMTSGLPRLEELTNLTKTENLKVTGGSFEYDDEILKNGTKKEKLMRINSLRKDFEYNTFEDFCDISIEKIDEHEPTNEFEKLLGLHKIHKIPKWLQTWVDVYEMDMPDLDEGFVIKCNVKKEMLYKYQLTLHDLVDKLDFDKYFAVPSPPNESIIYIYPNYDNISLPKTIDGDLDNWRYYYTRDVCVTDIQTTCVCGIPGIQQIFYAGDSKIDVQGHNFVELMKNTKLNFETLETDVIWEVYEHLGIDAAYIFLYEELSKCMAKKLNPSHFMLLARTMTNEGILTNVTRNGISSKVGVLTKASFETPVVNFLSAATWGENDCVDSLASSYFLGVVGKYGTRNPNFQLLDRQLNEIKC